MSNAASVLDRKAELLQRLTTLPYRRFLGDFITDIAEKTPDSHTATVAHSVTEQIKAEQGHDVTLMDLGTGWAAKYDREIRASESFYVAPDMTDVIAMSSLSLDETDLIRHDLLPAEVGFAYFAKPLRMTDVWGQDSMIRLVTWHVGRGGDLRPGVWVTLWGDMSIPGDIMHDTLHHDAAQWAERKGRALDDVLRETFTDLGSVQPVHEDHLAWGTPVGGERQHIDADYQTKWFNKLWVQDSVSKRLADLPETEPNIWRDVMSFWMLLGQTITTVTDGEVPRPYAKRARRAGIPPRVTVIELRRREGKPSDGGETHVEWSHRWLVRGHWAWRVCSQSNPEAQPYKDGWAVRVFISGYVKGPEGKPFHQAEHVYALLR